MNTSFGIALGLGAGLMKGKSNAMIKGTLLGGLLASGAMGKSAFAPQYLALVLICFLLGGAAAVWQLAKANVFTVMAGE